MSKLEALLNDIKTYKQSNLKKNVEDRLNKVLQVYVKSLNDASESVLSKKHRVVIKELSK